MTVRKDTILSCDRDGSARAMCPNRRSRLVTMAQVTGGCLVLRLMSL